MIPADRRGLLLPEVAAQDAVQHAFFDIDLLIDGVAVRVDRRSDDGGLHRVAVRNAARPALIFDLIDIVDIVLIEAVIDDDVLEHFGRIEAVDKVVVRVLFVAGVAGHTRNDGHRGVGVDRTARDLYRIAGQHRRLKVGDIAREAVGDRQHQRHAYDAYTACDRGHDRPSFFCHKVAEGQLDRGQETHTRALEPLLFLLDRQLLVGRGGSDLLALRLGVLFGSERIAVADDLAVFEPDDARRISVRKLGVVRDHDDEPRLGDLFEKVHDLDAGRAVERAGRLVGKNDLGVVDQRTRDRNALHLTAGKLIGQLLDLLGKPDLCESFSRTPVALGAADAGQRQSHRDVVQNGHVRNEVVTLKDKTYPEVAVCVPIDVLVDLGRHAVDQQIARRIAVETADDVEERGLAAARLSQHGHEFGVAEFEVDALERADDAVAHGIVFGDVTKFEHKYLPFSCRTSILCQSVYSVNIFAARTARFYLIITL